MFSVDDVVKLCIDTFQARHIDDKRRVYNRRVFRDSDLEKHMPCIKNMSDTDLDYCVRMYELCDDLFDRAGDDLKLVNRISVGMSKAFKILSLMVEEARLREEQCN